MAKKSYKWLGRLIDRITRKEQSNNDCFTYYGRRITLQSGTRDYVSVNVSSMDYSEQTDFAFDYWTKELDFTGYSDYDERDAIIKAFKSIYGRGVGVGYDQPWEEEHKFYEPMLDNDEYDQKTIMRKYNKLMSRKAA